MTLQAGDIVFIHTYGGSTTDPPAGHYGVAPKPDTLQEAYDANLPLLARQLDYLNSTLPTYRCQHGAKTCALCHQPKKDQ